MRQRRHALQVHAADLGRREAADAQQAQQALLEFTQVARARRMAPVALRARSHDGRHRYRTGLRGWYLRPDEGIAVGQDAQFYILSVPRSLRARLRGARVQPAQPRLVIGEGGRDGERIALRTLLDRLLHT